MSTVIVVLVLSVAWVAIGLAVSVVMGRRGHFHASWLVLGVVLGPLSVPLAVATAQREEAATPRLLGVGIAGPGPVDVVVGVDGSAESSTALGTVVTLLGERLGRLTLAAVLDFDTAASELEWYERKQAVADLARDADEVTAATGRRPETELLAGQPAEALQRFATDGGFELLAVGCRGQGLSKRILGSVAAQLASGAAVPVLIVSGQAKSRLPSSPAAQVGAGVAPAGHLRHR